MSAEPRFGREQIKAVIDEMWQRGETSADASLRRQGFDVEFVEELADGAARAFIAEQVPQIMALIDEQITKRGVEASPDDVLIKALLELVEASAWAHLRRGLTLGFDLGCRAQEVAR